jgi:uncharacterized membrane protein YccC
MSAPISPQQAAAPAKRKRSRFKPDGKQLRHALRTGLAAMLTFLVAELLHLKQGYWAVITAVIVMQAHLGGSLAASWSRVLGTAVGACLGVIAVLSCGRTLPGLSLAVFTTVLICAYLNKRHDSFRLAGITAVVVMIASETGGTQDILELGLHRFLEISLGVGVALLVALFVLPSRATQVLQQNASRSLEDLATYYRTVFRGYMDGALDAGELAVLKNRAAKRRDINRQLLGEARKESLGGSETHDRIRIVLKYADRLFESVSTMQRAAENHDAEGFRLVLAPALNALAASSETAIRELAEQALAKKPLEELPAFCREDALAKALEKLEIELLELRRSRESRRYRFDEVIHFFSFLLAMQEIGGETLATAEALCAPQHAHG